MLPSETYRYGIGAAEAEDCRTIDTRNSSRKERVADTLEKVCQLSNECSNTQLKDCQIYGKVQRCRHDIEEEILFSSDKLCLYQIIFS